MRCTNNFPTVISSFVMLQIMYQHIADHKVKQPYASRRYVPQRLHKREYLATLNTNQQCTISAKGRATKPDIIKTTV